MNPSSPLLPTSFSLRPEPSPTHAPRRLKTSAPRALESEPPLASGALRGFGNVQQNRFRERTRGSSVFVLGLVVGTGICCLVVDGVGFLFTSVLRQSCLPFRARYFASFWFLRVEVAWSFVEKACFCFRRSTPIPCCCLETCKERCPAEVPTLSLCLPLSFFFLPPSFFFSLSLLSFSFLPSLPLFSFPALDNLLLLVPLHFQHSSRLRLVQSLGPGQCPPS